MKWSWKIARVAGIDIYIHATFLLLLLWAGFEGWQAEKNSDAALESMLFILTLFCCVVLHELGHSLTAQRFGIRTRDITLLPIGGVASMERMPEKPTQEILVAFAGPAVNIVIASLIAMWMVQHGQAISAETFARDDGSFLPELMAVNIMLAVFNLLPAFPMDGGRVLRAILAYWFERVRATTIAVRVGQVFATLFILFGLLNQHVMLVLIGMFVWFGGSSELSLERMKTIAKGINIRQAMLRQFHTLSPQDTLAHVVELVLQGGQHDFPVHDGERYIGVLAHRDLLQALVDHGATAPVSAAVLSRIGVADINEPLQNIVKNMQEEAILTVIITEQGKASGLVTLENVLELFSIQSAMLQHREPHHREPPAPNSGKRWM